MIDLSCLNEEQRKAAQDTEGAVLVFAGAGSGKTRVLTYRVANLVATGVDPYNILAITFTNKAANEMKSRVADMLGECGMWISTFHSFCTQILFRHAEKIGYQKGFSIFDESASRRTLQKVLREKHLDEDKDKDKYAWHISAAKNAGQAHDEYFQTIRAREKDAMRISEVYERYESLMKENNAMDFDDLLVKCVMLFKENPDVLAHYSNRFRYVHVDEFQDTNAVQLELVRLLCGKWKNVFVVGDDDQSIYSWRGADVKNILDFDKYFEQVKVYKLEQNYRSTTPILDCANNLIKNNASRAAKTLFSEIKGGVRVEYSFYPSEYREVDGVVEIIKSLKRFNGYTNKDFAILVRQNSLTRLYEINFNKAGLYYKVFGSYKFFDRKEIQDILAYLRVIANPRDTEALERIINFPARGIGATTLERLRQWAAEKNVMLFDAIADIKTNDTLSMSVRAKIGAFADLMNELAFMSQTNKFSEFVPLLVNKLGLEEHYKASEKEEDENRWENVVEFLTHVKENYENKEISVTEFLHTVSLVNEKEDTDDPDYITIATMHAVKGLEFKVVFIIACEENIIPSARSLKEPNGLEEERRVMYVAVTRAQQRLYISCVNGERTKFGKKEFAMPSRFIAETKNEKVQLPELGEGESGNNKRYGQGKQRESYYNGSYAKNNTGRDIFDEPAAGGSIDAGYYFAPNKNIENKPTVQIKDTKGFVSGAKIRHRKYGVGTVILAEGEGIGRNVTVMFKDLGVKKFSVASAPINLE